VSGSLRPVVFVAGCPGVGKSAVCRALLGVQGPPVGRWSVGSRFCALGPYSGTTHDGADALPVASAVFAKAFGQLDDPTLAPLVALLDGVRFGRWVLPYLERSLRPRLSVLLSAPAEVLAARRQGRGSKPVSRVWLDTEIAQARRAASEFGRVVQVDANRSLQAVVHSVLGAIS